MSTLKGTAEKPFQEIADEHGAGAVEWMREDLEALEHARGGCDGDCETCDGNGRYESRDGNTRECKDCGGTGKCLKGKGSDDLESWHDEDAARRRIEERPLSLVVRSGWYLPGSEDNRPSEFCILLGTGGPAARIVGTLDEHGQPDWAHYEFQDWGTPWTRARLSGDDGSVLLRYAQCFYFGE